MLGIVSDTPEVDDNATVALTPIVSDVKEEGREVSIKKDALIQELPQVKKSPAPSRSLSISQ